MAEQDEFEIDEVYIGSHKFLDLVKDQGGFPACVYYAVSELIKYIVGCHPSPLIPYLKINDGRPCSEGCEIEQVLRHAKKFGFFKEESLNEERTMKNKKLDKNQNTSHMNVVYGIKDFKSVFVGVKKLDKKLKEERLKDCLKKFNVPIVIGVNGIDFNYLKPGYSRHAVTVYGWNKHGFRFKNSWGPMTGNNLYNNGKAIFPYEYTHLIDEAYYAIGIEVKDRNIVTEECTVRPDLGFGHFQAYAKEVKITQEVTKANVQNLLSELKYIKNSVQYITLSKIAVADRQSVKNTLILAFGNVDEWPGLKSVKTVKVESCPKKDYLYRR